MQHRALSASLHVPARFCTHVRVFRGAFELWRSPTGLSAVHVTLSDEPLPVPGALIRVLCAACSSLPADELVLCE